MTASSLLRLVCLIIPLLCCLPGEGAFAAVKGALRAPVATEGNAAADTDTARAAASKAVIKAEATPIAVEHQGTDTLGAKLAFQLKELFNAGTLFALSDKDEPKLQMHVVSVAEFSSRPGVGSVYSVVWVYSERSTVLSNYLAHEAGVVTPDSLADLVDRLAARTAGLAAKHAYIFSK